jgi:dipeptidyl aminopeptidase/acylaminoacyl peptidase/tetratricopeptide (TPR) repeat protein
MQDEIMFNKRRNFYSMLCEFYGYGRRLKLSIISFYELNKIYLKYLWRKVIDRLIAFLVLIVLFFVISFLFAGIGWFSRELGINQTIWLIPGIGYTLPLNIFLNYLPTEEELIFMIELMAAVLLGILLIGILRDEDNIIVLPFDVDYFKNTSTGNDIQGKTIAEMLIVELHRIRVIHNENNENAFKGNLPQVQLPRDSMPNLMSARGENISQFMESLGPFSLGPTTFQLGSILILIRKLCPFTNPGHFIAGCLLICESDICLLARLKERDLKDGGGLWELHKDFKLEINKISYDDLLELIRTLSFEIFFDLMKDYGLMHDDNERLRSFTEFKHYTEAVAQLNKYYRTKNWNEIENARKSALRAFSVNYSHEGLLSLLFVVEMIYLYGEKKYEAEALARYIVNLRPDSALAWYYWGLALLKLNLSEEAAECSDVGLKRIVHLKHKIGSELFCLKALALRGLGRYNESIEFFEKAIETKLCGTGRDIGCIWGHYGITLEAYAKEMKNDEYLDKAENAYNEAIKYFPGYIEVHTALTRLYKRREFRTEEEKDQFISERCECAIGNKAFKELNEYNKACFYIICGYEDMARDLLSKAIKKEQITYQWLKDDPDWKVVEKEVWFIELLNSIDKPKEKPENVDHLIKKAAIREKLNKMNKIKPSLLYNYDIRNPGSLASTILKQENKISQCINLLLKNETRNNLSKHQGSELVSNLNQVLNKHLSDPDFCKWLNPRDQIEKDISEQDIQKLNRKILAEAYPESIKSGRTLPEIKEKIMEKIEFEPSYVQARFYAVFGETNKAIESLKKAVLKERIDAETIKFEPDFENIRDEPQFKDLIREEGNKKKVPELNSPQITACGSWKSPITSDLIVSETIGLEQTALDGSDIYWIESRPAEGGRYVIVRLTSQGKIEDLIPAPFNCRTLVHEYGGGAYCVFNRTVFFSNFADQRIYRRDPGEDPKPITPPGKLRYADGVIDARRNRMICVCEDHSISGQEAKNCLVEIDLDGAQDKRILAKGYDFYSSPRLSPDGKRLAWLSWRHPNMPWDGTELWVGEIEADGSLGKSELIAGGPEEAIAQPEWSADGILHFVSDRTGWWNLYRWKNGNLEALTETEAEFARPMWRFRLSSYSFVSPDLIICAFTQSGTWRLATLDVNRRSFIEMDLPFTEISDVRANGNYAVFIAGSPVKETSIVKLDIHTKKLEILRRSSRIDVDDGYLSRPQTITYPTSGGLSSHAFYYSPKNKDFQAPACEKPPLLVISHGGPTGAASSALNLMIQHWTSRGIAVVDVNYGGSTGYGRAYRERLKDRWGIVDVDDCINAALCLENRGEVDRNRLIIRGGSAGGYTTLASLTFRSTFKAGASYYGICDLEVLAKETHKFESRYLNGLVGPYPEHRAIYLERSPIHSPERLSCPVIFFQGLEDKIVPPNQARMMFEALRSKGIPVALVEFAGEQHGFRKAENIKRSLDAELYFYSRIFEFEPAEFIEPVPIENLKPKGQLP